MHTTSRLGLTDWSLVALTFLNFFLADARDGLEPFLDGFLATHGWSPMTLGIDATLGGVLGMVGTPPFGAWSTHLTTNARSSDLPIVERMPVASWWRSPATDQHPLQKTASSGFLSFIG